MSLKLTLDSREAITCNFWDCQTQISACARHHIAVSVVLESTDTLAEGDLETFRIELIPGIPHFNHAIATTRRNLPEVRTVVDDCAAVIVGLPFIHNARRRFIINWIATTNHWLRSHIVFLALPELVSVIVDHHWLSKLIIALLLNEHAARPLLNRTTKRHSLRCRHLLLLRLLLLLLSLHFLHHLLLDFKFLHFDCHCLMHSISLIQNLRLRRLSLNQFINVHFFLIDSCRQLLLESLVYWA